MSNDFHYPVASVASVNFLEALAQNVSSAMNILYGLPPINSRRYFIRAMSIVTKENFGPQFSFYAAAAGDTSNPATNKFVSRFGFLSSMGVLDPATGCYNYYVDGLAVPYFDDDTANSVNPPRLHVILTNISATAKSADDAGAVAATFWVQPMQAF